MIQVFTLNEGSLFFRLLLAHLLTDFIFQSDQWVNDKRKRKHRSPYLYWHGFIAIATTYLLLGDFLNPWPALVIGITHTLIDLLKLRYDKANKLSYFLLDQFAHLFVLLFVWIIYTDNYHRFVKVVTTFLADLRIITILTGYVICTMPLAIIIGIATRKWQQQLPPNPNSLPDAGRWIGISERLLIFTFVLVNQYEAIGFLIAAKSLLRFRDSDHAPLQSEYVLVGTLLSYTLAVGLGLLTKLIIDPL